MPVPSTRALVIASAGAYTANCLLGMSVAAGALDTSGNRWAHHALYVVTATLTVAAVLAGAARRSAAGVVLAPALLPLAVLPYVGHAGHVGTATSAAPWYAGALLARAA